MDAGVVPAGVEPDGAAEVPDDPSEAGWYRFGAAPGSTAGSAVLMGHVDARTGDLGEFAALYEVREGDTVTVRRESGASVRYRVTARTTVPKDELPDRTFRRDGPPSLALITCAPPYEPERGGYLNNVVVTAEPLAGG